jgi:AraC-like DNA-binding protein
MRWSSTKVTPVQFGRECRCGSTALPRHRHPTAYLSLILSGGHEEAGDRGRLRASEGQVLFHGPFEAHRNSYSAQGAQVLNLALGLKFEPVCPVMFAPDPDAVVRLAEVDPRAAASLVIATAHSVRLKAQDWPEVLSAAILSNPGLKLGAWSEQYGLADATVTRGFRQVFGIAPSGYRAQVRARLALQQIIHDQCSLATIAARCGFFDQAHMTHAVVWMTGASPGAWRRRVKLVQDSVPPKREV